MKSEKKNTILVPTDLTFVAECSMDHAVEIARLFNRKIILLHVMAKKKDDEDVKMKLEQKASKYSEDSDLEVTYLIAEGSIFTTISKVAEDVNAEFIIMGIHGKKGMMQHIVGSYAYKVITSSKVPVLVVKKKHTNKEYKNIVLPIDFTAESTQKVSKAIRFAKYFDASIRIIGFLATKSSVWKIKKEVILQKVTDHIKQAGVDVTAEIIIQPGAVIHDVVLDYAEKVKADMIMIVAEIGDSFTDIFSRNSAEQIVDKSDLPVLNVIPDPVKDEDYTSKQTVFKPFIDPLGLIKNDNDL